jgi:hypothetical protein
MARYGGEAQTPGYIESVASSKRKTKENLRLDELIPTNILQDQVGSGDQSNQRGIKELLKSYYEFNNMEEFIYQETEVFLDTILSKQAIFRVKDPENSNDHFFSDFQGASSTLLIKNTTDADMTVDNVVYNPGQSIPISLTGANAPQLNITNGNELPGSLKTNTNPHGKTFRIVFGDNTFDGLQATFTTVITYWVGPGPSYVLNAIEEALDIDENTEDYLEMMQKEVAAAIPRDLSNVDKRSLYKKIVDFYKVRGSSDSIEIFFRLLFNEEVEVERPWDKTLIPSSGAWDASQGQYLDHKGWLSDEIKIQDSDFYQKFSYLIRTGRNVTDWSAAFSKLVHPAGFKFFGEILILLQLTRKALGDNTKAMYEVPHIGGPKHGQGTGQFFYGYPRINRLTLSSMPDRQPGVIGIEDVPVLVKMFASMFEPRPSAFIKRSGQISINLQPTTLPNGQANPNVGKILSAEIAKAGYGYPINLSTETIVNGEKLYAGPTVTITGAGGSAGAVTCKVTASGSLSPDGFVITNVGSGYTEIAASIPAVSNPGTISKIFLHGLSDVNHKYRIAPKVVIDAPTAKNALGQPLSTNVQATASLLLQPTTINNIQIVNGGSGYSSAPTVTISGGGGSNATAVAQMDNGNISRIVMTNHGSGYTSVPTVTVTGNGILRAELVPSSLADTTIITPTNAGNGYIFEPEVRLGSGVQDEVRAKDTTMILQLVMNLFEDTFEINHDNNFYNIKKNNWFPTRKFRDNVPLKEYGANLLTTTSITNINRYNGMSSITYKSTT